MAGRRLRRRPLPFVLLTPAVILAAPCASFLSPLSSPWSISTHHSTSVLGAQARDATAAKKATIASVSDLVKEANIPAKTKTAPARKIGTRKKADSGASVKLGSHSHLLTDSRQPSKARKAKGSTPEPTSRASHKFPPEYPVSFDDRWNQRYEELKAYKSLHGDCLVPQSPTGLGRWVSAQRVEYRCLRKGHDSCITPDRVARLNALGFVWDAKEATWRERLEELRTYKEQHGHCNVKQDDEEHRKLALWVRNQRMHHTYIQRGEKDKSSLTPKRIQLLDDVGFLWNVRDAAWMEKFEMLRKFRAENGHCNVPSQYKKNMPLARWVLSLRVQMREKNEAESEEQEPMTETKRGRKSTRLTQKRIDLLNSIGFVWEPGDDFWWERYSDLKAYKKEHGHCSVPVQYAPNPKLGHWVANQRRLCRQYADAALALGAAGTDRVPVSGLNEARLDALREIDFCYLPSAKDIASASKSSESPRMAQKPEQATSLLPGTKMTKQLAEEEKKKTFVPFPWDEI